GRVPYPPDSGLSKRIGELALTAYRLKRELDCSNETSRVFYLPALLQVRGADLHDRIERWNERVRSVEQTLEEIHRTIDTLVFDLYGLDQYDRQSLGDLDAVDAMRDSSASVDEDEDTPSDNTALTLVVDLLSWCVGSVFGRWDVKRALPGDGSAALPDDPFAPLPPCSPGMLVGSEGLPAKPSDTTPDYPIHIQWTGIMPDDEGHPYDLITHVRNVLVQLFPDAYAVEQEACRILGVKDLRQFFGSKFFPLHIQRYSKSRRKAPIYWLLQSSRKSYGLWLYYPRLNRDTLYVALREYVEPKLGHEQEELAKLKAEYAQAKEGGDRGARSLARKVEAQEDLIQEIAAFRDEIKAVADAGYDPDPDDGVLINIAPLHKLVPWKEAAACYKELKAGKYPWATMYKRYKFR
ncbi:MAG: hypothetical protein CW346_18715, partial [Bacillaceae bacterium]|nr:hypothetical protein [Bacillaceae bacterium]